MKFIVHFSSQGRFLSRNLHRSIKENISRAMDAFAITGVDPNRYASRCQQIIRLPNVMYCVFFWVYVWVLRLIYAKK